MHLTRFATPVLLLLPIACAPPALQPLDTLAAERRSGALAGETSRINVAHFMADLITDDGLWSRWKGQMPVIYNQRSS